MNIGSERKGSTIGGILLVSGTCIGAGMLALPLVVGAAGFGTALVINALCWLFVLATGLLYLEVALWMEEGAHIISMARRFLGRVGEWLAGGVFLLLFYCLMTAYLAHGSPLLQTVLEPFVVLNTYVSFTLFCGFFLTIVVLGTSIIDHLNWVLMAGLTVSYFLMLGTGSSEVDARWLLHMGTWQAGWIALPIFFSAYGYHNIIPSITAYLDRNVHDLRWAIIIGSSLPFVVYTLWLGMVMGTLPQEQLAAASAAGTPVSTLLIESGVGAWLGQFTMLFSFFAITTSLLGVSLSMVDFLGDGLRIRQRTGWRRLVLSLLVFLPPAYFAAGNPHVFQQALQLGGGLGEAFLNGLLPALMVWIGRYHHKLVSGYQLPGGRWSLGLLITFSLLVIAGELFTLWMP